MRALRHNHLALLDMAPEHRRPARRDGAHDASLDAPIQASVLRLSERFAMAAAEDIRHLQSRSHGSPQPGGTTSKRSRSSDRARPLLIGFGGDPGVARRA